MCISRCDYLCCVRSRHTLQTGGLTDRCDLCRTQPIRSRYICQPTEISLFSLLSCHHLILNLINLQSSRSTSGPKFIFPVTVWKINLLSLLEGQGNSIFLSNRPGRKSAGSSVSCRLVAMITYIALPRKVTRTRTPYGSKIVSAQPVSFYSTKSCCTFHPRNID